MKKKIIFVVASMAGGGAERVIAILSNQFVKKGLNVSIMMTAGNEVVYNLDPKIELISIGGRTAGSMTARIQRVKKMREHFKKNVPAIIIPFGVGESVYAVAANMGLRNKMIISERNDPAACKYPGLRNWIYSRADYRVYQTVMAKESFPKYLQKNSQVIPNPVSSALPQTNGEEREKKIAAVGRLENQKNYPMMLKAYSLFYKIHPDYKLHIYGKGYLLDELKILAEELNITEGIVWEGFCSNVWKQITNAAMYVLSSDYEGISNSMLEALALGLPVISTDCPIGGSRMCITHKENGMLIPVGDSQALAKAMCEIVEDKSLARKLSENAYKIREKFSEENISNQWINIIREI